MRGGRNKFGPMYKYHRALRQQALRQRQLLLAQGVRRGPPYSDPHNDVMFVGTPLSPGVPPDIKPDVSCLNVRVPVPLESVPVPAAVCAASRADFYRFGNDPIRPATASYPACSPRPPPFQEAYVGPTAEQRQYTSTSYNYDTDMSPRPSRFAASTDSRCLTPLAGLSHMMNDVPNFVGQSAWVRLRRIYPGPMQSRSYPSQAAHVPFPSYQRPPVIGPVEELRRNVGAVPSSSFPAVLSESSASEFLPHQLPRSSQTTGSLSSSSENVVADAFPGHTADASLPSPATACSTIPPPSQGPSKLDSQPPSTR